MDVMASPTGLRIEINVFAFHVWMFISHFPVTAEAGPHLPVLVIDRVNFNVHPVAGRAIDITPVVRTSEKLDQLPACPLFRMTGKAGVQLFLSW